MRKLLLMSCLLFVCEMAIAQKVVLKVDGNTKANRQEIAYNKYETDPFGRKELKPTVSLTNTTNETIRVKLAVQVSGVRNGSILVCPFEACLPVDEGRLTETKEVDLAPHSDTSIDVHFKVNGGDPYGCWLGLNVKLVEQGTPEKLDGQWLFKFGNPSKDSKLTLLTLDNNGTETEFLLSLPLKKSKTLTMVSTDSAFLHLKKALRLYEVQMERQ